MQARPTARAVLFLWETAQLLLADAAGHKEEQTMKFRFSQFALLATLCAAPVALHAQFDFKLDGRDVQVHSFASQGFMYSNQNNYLTTDTSHGSFAFTDAGANISSPITDHFRVGAQVYFRNVGAMGNFRPTLDWALGAYKFKSWFGIRGGG
jgi:hypothetical protein